MRLVGQVLSWVATLVVIRLLAPSDYGILALAQLLIGFALLINEIGLTPALIQARHAPPVVIASVHGYVLLSNVLLYTLVYFLAPLFAHFYGVEDLVSVIRVLALQLLIGAFGAVPSALAKRNLEFKYLSLIGLTATVLGSLASLLVALLDGGVWALVSANLVMGIVQSVGVSAMTRFNVAPSLRLSGMRQLVSFGAWISGSRLAWYSAQSADDLLIGKVFNNEVLGHFNVAKNLAAIPMSRIMEIINQVTFPIYSRLDNNADRALTYFLKSVWLGMLVFCPVTWGLSSVADVFTSVALGDKWAEAAFPIRIIALSIPIQALSFLLTPVIDALGRPDIGFRNSIARLVIFPLSVVVAIPWGLDGICITFLIGRLITLLMFVRIARVVVPVTMKSIWRAVAAPVIASTVMYAGVTFSIAAIGKSIEPAIVLGLGVAIGALIYTGMLVLFAPQTYGELKSLYELS